jgi:hypothetical protein
VSVTEDDINPAGVAPGDARLLVVCNKFETGEWRGVLMPVQCHPPGY